MTTNILRRTSADGTALLAIHGTARYRLSLNIINVLLHFAGVLPAIADIDYLLSIFPK
ncbi:hypothetical protein [Colwellia sp. M166]|uniref:hypothetical protein n=1 Tax=Colwellia sp. M166 TaxID=2583805 RepID=UPI00211ED3C9|nr:hypothetical protein [Colwellia sp. M166]|tara:strand:+ start:928 stop:1101 length:174 start_codon:yes stop_codon:yes gene_type:complete